jgi:hypothetical protein
MAASAPADTNPFKQLAMCLHKLFLMDSVARIHDAKKWPDELNSATRGWEKDEGPVLTPTRTPTGTFVAS